MRIYTVQLALGAFLVLFAIVILTIGGHNHPPGEFLYRSSILEAEVANDPVQANLLREDQKVARRRIMKIQDDTNWCLIVVLAAGVINLFSGAYLRADVKRRELIETHAKLAEQEDGSHDGG
jgi:hypothetical protein